tara:strand:- start:372 stop:881 length:510 start_codon:yes stop_codon:yes gene_type:complete
MNFRNQNISKAMSLTFKYKPINAFSLVEVLIALSIFGVIALGLTQLNKFWISKGKESIQSADNMQNIALSMYKIKNELSRCKQFNSPSLRLAASHLNFVIDDRIIRYRFVKQQNQSTGKLFREEGLQSKLIIAGIDDIKFFRLENQLLQISYELKDKALTTRIYLRGLK